jgi:diguanylate cyclase (GGDEF)-like protein
VVKPFDELELRARLRAGQRVVDLQSELYRLNQEFLRQSRTDPVTGALNRRAIMERLASELARVRRTGKSLGVGLVDVDHFKAVNDGHGHAAGDAALCELARRIETGSRGADTFGRIGGDEFLVVWTDIADAGGAAIAAERLRERVGREPFAVGGRALRVTVSVGATSTRGDEPADAIVARADAALYSAKAHGRDRVESAAPPEAPPGRTG